MSIFNNVIVTNNSSKSHKNPHHNDVNIDEIESVGVVSLISMTSLSRSAGVTIIESSCPWRERAFRISRRCSSPTSSRIVI